MWSGGYNCFYFIFAETESGRLLIFFLPFFGKGEIGGVLDIYVVVCYSLLPLVLSF